jgi:hypothetical protein
MEASKPVDFSEEHKNGGSHFTMGHEYLMEQKKRMLREEENTIEEISKFTNESIRALADVRKSIVEINDAIQ